MACPSRPWALFLVRHSARLAYPHALSPRRQVQSEDALAIGQVLTCCIVSRAGCSAKPKFFVDMEFGLSKFPASLPEEVTMRTPNEIAALAKQGVPTAAELSRRSGLSQSTICTALRGGNPTFETLARLNRAIDEYEREATPEAAHEALASCGGSGLQRMREAAR